MSNEDPPDGATEPSDRAAPARRITLALGGSGARGLAHIGVTHIRPKGHCWGAPPLLSRELAPLSERLQAYSAPPSS